MAQAFDEWGISRPKVYLSWVSRDFMRWESERSKRQTRFVTEAANKQVLMMECPDQCNWLHHQISPQYWQFISSCSHYGRRLGVRPPKGWILPKIRNVLENAGFEVIEDAF